MESNVDPCKPTPDRDIDYYASGIATIMRIVVGGGNESTHAYVKDVRKALETLVYIAWNKSRELIPLIAASNIPSEIYSEKLRLCYRDLLTGLLERFREIGDDLSVGSRIKLMNIIIRAMAENARSGIETPVGKSILDFLNINKPDSKSTPGGGTS